SFFFQAEDGIRDRNVTGVQTCALPISSSKAKNPEIFLRGDLLFSDLRIYGFAVFVICGFLVLRFSSFMVFCFYGFVVYHDSGNSLSRCSALMDCPVSLLPNLLCRIE